MTAARIILALATIALAGCDGSAPSVDHERRVGSPVSDTLDCPDECGEPDSSVVSEVEEIEPIADRR